MSTHNLCFEQKYDKYYFYSLSLLHSFTFLLVQNMDKLGFQTEYLSQIAFLLNT